MCYCVYFVYSLYNNYQLNILTCILLDKKMKLTEVKRVATKRKYVRTWI